MNARYEEIMAAIAPNYRWTLADRNNTLTASAGGVNGAYTSSCMLCEDGPLGARNAVKGSGSGLIATIPTSLAQSLNGATELWLFALARADNVASVSSERNAAAILSGNATLISVGLASNGRWRMGGRSRTSDSFTQVTSPSAPSEGEWALLAGRLKFSSSAVAELYLNGALVGSATPTASWASTLSAGAVMSPWTDAIGGINNVAGGTQFWAGSIDDVALKAGALPSGALAKLAAAACLNRRVTGSVSMGAPPKSTDRRILLISVSDEYVAGVTSSSDGEYAIDLADGRPVWGVAVPDYGGQWEGGRAHAEGDRVWVGEPAPIGHWYECEQAGTTGTTEPTWPTDGSTVNDGTVIWRDKGVMERPWAEGPYLPEAP